MSIIPHSGTPRDAFHRSNVLAMRLIHQARLYPFGRHGPRDLALVAVE